LGFQNHGGGEQKTGLPGGGNKKKKVGEGCWLGKKNRPGVGGFFGGKQKQQKTKHERAPRLCANPGKKVLIQNPLRVNPMEVEQKEDLPVGPKKGWGGVWGLGCKSVLPHTTQPGKKKKKKKKSVGAKKKKQKKKKKKTQ